MLSPASVDGVCGGSHARGNCTIVWIQLEFILHVPLLDVGGTGGENRQTGNCVVNAHRQVELSVIEV